MALAASLLALAFAGAFSLFCAGVGSQLLRLARVHNQHDLGHVLLAIGIGVAGYETLLGAALFIVSPRAAVLGCLLALLIGGSFGLRESLAPIRRLVSRLGAGSRTEHFLVAAACCVIVFQSLAALAPLTGSDALHYHFTHPALWLRDGFAPNFSLANSFYTGQGHLLILTGLALGSEKFSLALIFFGVVFAAAAAALLARNWASREWAWLCALTFLLTPVVFWQATTSGAPDTWLAFFATLGVLLVSQARAAPVYGLALAAGCIAGAVAGAKYTGCIIAAVLLFAFWWESRSARRTSAFFAAALCAGCWPYLRNALWTGDPLFPFLLRHLSPSRVNSFTLRAMMADTGASTPRTLSQLVKFPFFAAIDPTHLGFWQFLGPLVLAFAPLLLLVVRDTPLWRVTLLAWSLSALGIGASSGMTRFLFPLLPMALAAVFAGVAALQTQRRIWAHRTALLSLAAFLALGTAGLLMYARAAAAASIGFTPREAYLRQHAPDYEKTVFINQALAGQGSQGKILVFFRHLYYLQPPFLYGDPNGAWDIDPQSLASPDAWLEWLRSHSVRWVVRAPEYPRSIAAPLLQLEQQGALIPVAQGEVEDFIGMRINGLRQPTSIVILRVAP